MHPLTFCPRACATQIVARRRRRVSNQKHVAHGATEQRGGEMSGKSFRVSDGDWICPDKKYVRHFLTLINVLSMDQNDCCVR